MIKKISLLLRNIIQSFVDRETQHFKVRKKSYKDDSSTCFMIVKKFFQSTIVKEHTLSKHVPLNIDLKKSVFYIVSESISDTVFACIVSVNFFLPPIVLDSVFQG